MRSHSSYSRRLAIAICLPIVLLSMLFGCGCGGSQHGMSPAQGRANKVCIQDFETCLANSNDCPACPPPR